MKFSLKNPPALFESGSPKETHLHAALFATLAKREKKSKQALLFLLQGPMGSGKTEWTRGFAKKYFAGSKFGTVTSPSYSVINLYQARREKLFHVDLFRLKDQDDLESIGFWDLLSPGQVILIEWGEMLPPQWPTRARVYVIKFEITGLATRSLRFETLSGF